MKKHFYFLMLLLPLCASVNAAPGDTTWVQAHVDSQFNHYGAFDSPVTFPDGSTPYRKIFMTVTLGKYQCPGNPQYCGDWDYTFQTFVMTPTGDTFELGRLITPYANESYPRTSWSWKQRYTFDVTDLYPVLKNNADVRVFYSGYSWGFTGDIKFAFIGGTPARNVTGIDRLYHGASNYGDPGNSIENFLPQMTKTVPAGTQSSALKFTITGHGADGTGCSEFCSKYYQVLTNGTQTAQKDIWRDNCGSNHMYPQSGTWVYDRGNWCPGDQVQVNTHVLPGLSAGSNYDINVDLEPYTKVGSGTPSYIIESAVFHYGGFNRVVDAEITDVISPNNHEVHYRENNFCGRPVIKVTNNGSQQVTSVKFEYSIGANAVSDYTWTGNIASLEEATIELPEPWALRVADTGATSTFTVKILQVNGQADEDATNNNVTVPFKPSPRWPVNLIVKISTNNSNVGGVSETSWKIVELGGNVVAQRNGMSPSTAYADTLALGPSCYKLIVEDQGCDGLYFWANPGGGSGNFSVTRTNSPFPLPLRGFFNGDFGCGFTQYFTTTFPTDVTAIYPATVDATIEAVPNPAQKTVRINLTGVSIEDGMIRVLDAMGRVVLEEPVMQVSQQLNIEPLANGVYTIMFANAKGKLQTRLLIAK